MFGECYVIGYVIHGEYYAQVVVDGQGGETGSQLDGGGGVGGGVKGTGKWEEEAD